MIRHVVLFTLKPGADREEAQAGLARLGEIPHVRAFEVVPNLKRDQIGNTVDLVVHGVFDDPSALDAYKAHPLYAEVTAQVRPLRDHRVAADFVTTL
ncbi:Dabb family protein [Roseospira marina]|uniref:Dabb family protein n=1 Tax=Roseospira marina TaxID=140057 RepID=A0A5M6ID96_9PROT|nr:Dabb family protein [Roseospira marina]KAA5606236.1 Dabb family protein [Roseospira marina]MBB4314388.1 quinol monooxygenase YgiN [Roseospira marina]MBB5087548.1 quinol monooxygenase YgiN [Roseospira marina]